MAIQVTVSAPKAFEWATAANEDTLKLQIAYTKRTNAATLRISVLGKTVSLNVSNQQPGSTVTYNASISLGRQPAAVTPTSVFQRTINARTSTSLTPPNGKCYAISASDATGLQIRFNGQTHPLLGNLGVVWCSGVTASLFNPAPGPVTITVYEVNEADVLETPQATFTELDAGGRTVDSGSAQVPHAKPFTIAQQQPSSVDVKWVA